MPEDPHLFTGEGERFRRYGRLLLDPTSGVFGFFEHDVFFQAKEFDVLYGDIQRKFAPMTSSELENPFLQQLVLQSFATLPIQDRSQAFEISVHMIRIQATPGELQGRPAPEGIHRDGYHFGSIHLMSRVNVAGAINQIYDLDQCLIEHTTLETPMDSIFFDDAAIFHGVSPFQQADETRSATRDMLILLYQPLAESPQRQGRRLIPLGNLAEGYEDLGALGS
ncbi:MAG: 2OG-Fe dioxygenase family protein [Bdellovibrionales bacterium]